MKAHFEDSCFYEKNGRQRLRKDAIPTIFSHIKQSSSRQIPSSERREAIRGRLVEVLCNDHDYTVLTENVSEKLAKFQPNENHEGHILTEVPQNISVVEISSIRHDHHLALLENRELKKEMETLKQKIKSSEETTAKMLSFLGDDQKLFLQKGKGNFRGYKWDDKTLRQALKLRFSCGAAGYDDLLKAGYPLPSISTLQKRTEHIMFESGILEEILEMMAEKVKSMNEQEVCCALTMDEMTLKPSVDYDLKSDSFIGSVTLPNQEGEATKALCFQLGGLAFRWKQVVGYFFTGNSIDGRNIGPICLELIKRAHSIGLKVVCLTNDFGSSNLACWN